MATPRKKPKRSGTEDLSGPEVFALFLNLFARAIDRFGWPGGAVLILFGFVEVHGTDKQKHEIIDMLIHPDSPGGKAIGLLVLLATGIFIAQHYYWKRRLSVIEAENERLAKWKSAHQQKLIPVDLTHTRHAGT